MRVVRNLYQITIALIVVFFLMLFVACSSQQKDVRVSAEEMTQLRMQYPYNDATASFGQVIPASVIFPNFEAFGEKKDSFDYSAVAVIEITSDWHPISTCLSPFEEEVDFNLPPAETSITWPVLNARIDKIIWGDGTLEKRDSIVLGFASDTFISGMELDKCYVKGQKYVCFLVEYEDSPFQETTIYQTLKEFSYYLTDRDVLVSITSTPGPDEASGMYLPAFETLINETLGPPDAELTPVEPELQTE